MLRKRHGRTLGATAVAILALGATASTASASAGLIIYYPSSPGIAEPGTGIEIQMSTSLNGGEPCLSYIGGALLHNARATDSATLSSFRSEGCTIGGMPTKITLSSKGRVGISASPKFAFRTSSLIERCEPGGCKTEELVCSYEAAKLTGTIPFGAGEALEFDLAGVLKRNAKTSASSCAKSLPYEGNALVGPANEFYPPFRYRIGST